MKTLFVLLFTLVMLTSIGCHTTNTTYSDITYETQVISDPPGVKIEVDNDYIGDTPTTITWHETSRRGYSKGCFSKNHCVEALPSASGQHGQSKLLFFGGRIPERIYFNMSIYYDITPKSRIDIYSH